MENRTLQNCNKPLILLTYILVAPNVDDIPLPEENLKENLKAHVAIDASGEKEVFIVPTSLAPKRIVFSGTGALDKDYDDVRR